jgi:hypothetical protein
MRLRQDLPAETLASGRISSLTITKRNDIYENPKNARRCSTTRLLRRRTGTTDLTPLWEGQSRYRGKMKIKAQRCSRLMSSNTPKTEARVRIQFELRENRYNHLKKLMELTGTETNKELFENALTLMEWAVEETLAGNVVGIMAPHTNSFQRLLFSPLRRLYHESESNEFAPAANITGNTNETGSGNASQFNRGKSSHGVATAAAGDRLSRPSDD